MEGYVKVQWIKRRKQYKIGGPIFDAYKEKWPQRDELCAKVLPIAGSGFVES